MCTGAANWTQYVIKDVRREQEIGSGVVGTGGMVRDGYDKNTLYKCKIFNLQKYVD